MVFYSIVTKKEIELGYMTGTNLLLLSILWHLQANYESQFDSLKQALQHTQGNIVFMGTHINTVRGGL